MQGLNAKKLTAAIHYIDSWIAINMVNSRFPGLQVAILQGDKIVYSKAFGYADVEKKTKMTTKSVFKIASHSKPFTATAIMQLYEAGKLNLDDKVSNHLDWFVSKNDERVAQVTIRQLLNHTAGLIRDGEDTDYWNLLRDFPDTQELKDYISSAKLIYNGDEQFKYSNFGYGYLGQVIEAVTGTSYAQFVHEHIIKKLGLNTTFVDSDSDAARKQLVTGYTSEALGMDSTPFNHAEARALAPATGFCSTAEDVCRFFEAHFHGNPHLLSDATKRYMHHGFWAPSEGETYGFGIESIRRNGWNLRGHGGGFPGFHTATLFDPEKQFAVAVFCNADGSNPKWVAQAISSIVDRFQNAPETDKTLKKFEGRFYDPRRLVVDIITIGTTLHTVYSLRWSDFSYTETLSVKDASTLVIKKAGSFSSAGEEVQYTFSADGEVASIRHGGATLLPEAEAKRRGWI